MKVHANMHPLIARCCRTANERNDSRTHIHTHTHTSVGNTAIKRVYQHLNTHIYWDNMR